MKQPQAGFNLPAYPGQPKTMFYTEGNPAAMLVTNRSGRQTVKVMKFATAEAVLAWCRSNGSMMVYCPVSLERN